MSNQVIAIDGPAGAGKSTVAKALARELGLSYLDTGAMYRSIALLAQRRGLGAEEAEQVAKLASEAAIEFEAGDPQRVLLNSEDVTEAIRTLEVSELASALSTYGPIRKILVERQKEIVAKGGVVLEGRDATTVVAPEADVKVYLTASLEERARRRHLELKGEAGAFGDVRQMVLQRDHRDITREDSPLTVADGATIIESGGLSVDEVVARIRSLISPGRE